MAVPKPNFTELTHQVVREAVQPLTLDEIVAGVLERSGGASTKNLKNTVRNAITQSSAIIATPAGSYGWKSRLLNGAVQRMLLYDEDFAERQIMLDELQRDLLQPNGPGHSKYGVAGPPQIALAGGPTIQAGVVTRAVNMYVFDVDDQFWDWLDAQGAQPDDSLLLTAVDVEARQYRLSFEPSTQRDEAALAARNQQVVEAAVGYVHRRKGRTVIWEIAGYLNASGLFHQIPAPEPFDMLWTPAVWQPLAEEYDVSPFLLGGSDPMDMIEDIIGDLLGGTTINDDPQAPTGTGVGPVITVGEHGTYQGELGVDPQLLQARIDQILANPGAPVPADDPLLPAIATVFAAMGLPSPSGQPYLASQLAELFGDDDEILDWIEQGAELGMVQIDPAYEAMFGADLDGVLGPFAPLPEPAARSGESRTLTLRVSYKRQPQFWREIEIADDQSLGDLHMAIQRAYQWDNDHLYSFFMGKRAYDRKTEIGGPGSDARRQADRVTVGELGLRTKQKFLYLFDFGDDHLFEIQVMRTNPKAPPGVYPRVVAEHGGHLAQYEDWDEDEDWEE